MHRAATQSLLESSQLNNITQAKAYDGLTVVTSQNPLKATRAPLMT